MRDLLVTHALAVGVGLGPWARLDPAGFFQSSSRFCLGEWILDASDDTGWLIVVFCAHGFILKGRFIVASVPFDHVSVDISCERTRILSSMS